ncbi:flagellar biosynthesis protein FliQ [Candidatus Latescibacterota bacterium]
MTTTDAVQLAREAMLVALLLAAPMLGFGLLVGLFVSIIQAVTQVNEMTLTFIPKIIAVMAALALFMPWIMRIIVEFTIRLLTSLPNP